ncbi:hypothetical protein ABFX02_03G086100 [Erythranthe guttata]
MDWNNLPQELVDLILSNVFAKDRLNFSVVCRSWNEAVSTSQFRHSPCLMFYQRSKHLWRFSQHDNFFDMEYPELENTIILSSNHGWLLMTSRDRKNLFFYNPFNNNMIKLPSPTDIYTTICFSHPPTSPNCFLVGIITDNPFRPVIGVLKHGEGAWKVLEYYNRWHAFDVSHSPPVLLYGLFIFLDVNGNVSSFDIDLHGRGSGWGISVRPLKQRRLRRNIKAQFLIKPKGEEEIFGVFAMHDDNRKIRVFRLDLDDLSWKLVEDLGNRVFYVSNTGSFGYTTNVKRMANKIFFPKFNGDSIIYYSLETQKYHSFDGSYSSNNSYDLRRMDLATWTMPTSSSTVDPTFTRESLTWF